MILPHKVLHPKKVIFIQEQTHTYLFQEILALLHRLFIQTQRRPSTIMSGMLQPLLWLLLFGALFQNAPVGLFTSDIKYNRFLSPGIVVFTSFTSSINAGLPLMFDREFGFLNRLIVAPLISKNSILISSLLFITIITMLQTMVVFVFSLTLSNNLPDSTSIFVTVLITLLITLSICSISIGLAFILPGHIELLALILITNLPILFSSTALAPLSFMPYWLQIIASLNPLTYAIESVRYLSIYKQWNFNSKIMENVWCSIHLDQTLIILIVINIFSFALVRKIMTHKLE